MRLRDVEASLVSSHRTRLLFSRLSSALHLCSSDCISRSMLYKSTMTSRDHYVGNRYESGNAKRKTVEQRKDEKRKLCGSLAQYFTTSVNKELELCSITGSEQPSSSTSHSSIKNDFTPPNLTY
ncbi:hypothetical protein J6590_061163 [Homalodisca vitripennis]|nr:hypothetical protein J6590_061163 [Homalodisca vitripennis]